jgi:hypothetical protein
MKKVIFLGVVFFIAPQLNAQVSSPWVQGGNTVAGTQSQTIGSDNNRNFRIETNNIQRAMFNRNVNYTISGYNAQHNGYMLLGTQSAGNNPLYNGTRGPYSQLHIAGLNGGATQSGYRPWMRTGVTYTADTDIAYVGLRNMGFGKTEFSMAWGNDQNVNTNSEDDMVFRFVRNGNGTTTVNNNLRSAGDLDGRHVARFTARGLMGLGNTFGVIGGANSLYVRPQSLLHLSYDLANGLANEQYGFMQITYRGKTGNTIGTGETQWDGLRLGIDNDVFTAQGVDYHNAYLRWQENSAFIIETDYNNIPDDNTAISGVGEERIRVTNTNALGVPKPNQLINGNSITRVGISARGVPLTEPRALLHLGRNITFPSTNNTLGWRNWMDNGMFINGGNNADNLYIGLKLTEEDNSDRTDVIFNWGDNYNPNYAYSGLLRFVFTANQNGVLSGSNLAAENYHGLEMMRMLPIRDTLGTFGRVGIGDFTVSGVNGEPTHKLDVVGNGRFRYLPDDIYMADDLVNKVVMVDSSGVLRWLDKDSLMNPVFPCWDINENGINDPNEDVNGDGVWNGLDCGTDDQIITNFAINGNTLTLTIENGNTVNVDLSQFLDNTDDQNLTSAILDPNTNILTISIENGNPVSVDLSGIVGTTNVTADNGLTLFNNNMQWGQVNTNGVSLNGGELIHHTEVPMNDFNVLFSGVGSDYTNTLSIGGVNSTRAKFNVYDSKKRIGIYTKIDDSQLTIPTNIVGLKTDVTSTNHFVYGTETTIDASGYTGGSPNYGELINIIPGQSWNIGSYININGQVFSPQNYGQKITVYSSAGANTGSQLVVQGGSTNNGLTTQSYDNNANINKGVVANIEGASQINIGIRGNITNATGSNYNIGVSGLVQVLSNNNSNLNAAGRFNITQNNTLSNTIYGIRTSAYHGGNQSNTYGTFSDASGLGKVYGGYFFAQAPNGPANNLYGIYAKTYGTGLNGTWAGYFAGNVHATGQISSTNGTVIASDQMFKTNVNNLTNSLDIINQLQPKTFYYDTTGYASFEFETDQQMGLIAQEVAQVLPTIVSDLTRPEQFDTLGNSIAPQINYKGVEYGELIPVLIGGIQEQQDMLTAQDSIINTQDSLITNLNDRLTSLENCLSNLLPLLCQINNNMIQQNDVETQRQLNNVLNVELNDSRNIILNQNVPNPFAEQTTISFSIPSTVNQAQIHFYDEKGNLIKTVELTERGNGQINVFASDLSTGTYTYTLVADGQVVATKRMIKVN